MEFACKLIYNTFFNEVEIILALHYYLNWKCNLETITFAPKYANSVLSTNDIAFKIETGIIYVSEQSV